jgi:DNA ligase-associated metallophosphoesterase
MLGQKTTGHLLEDFWEQPISLCGKAFVADMSGALYWPAEQTLIVADLHLEKGSAAAQRGVMLPPYDTRTTLGRLREAITRYEPAHVVSLGDSLHDEAAADRISREDLDTLFALQEGRDWVWITGNHDPIVPQLLRGDVAPALTISGVHLRHEPSPGPITHEIAGHLHPAAKVSLYGYTIRRPCFVGNGTRLILPAFGSFTGGLNILDEAFEPIFGSEGLSVWMLGQDGIYPQATRQLRGD